MAEWGGWWEALTRRRMVSSSAGPGELARVLGLTDLVGLAVGSTLGLGVYVLAGDVAKNVAGPAVVLSFLVAAVASLFAGLCYAEFAARVPRAGSAYVYSYVCVGEFVAFVIGWNLILEYLIGTASVARGYSVYVDSVFNNSMQTAFTFCCSINVPSLSHYPDFFSFFLVIALTGLLAFGVKESVKLNNVFTACNLAVVLLVIVCGAFKADLKNWQVDPARVPDSPVSLGVGGFFPFGFSGMMAGAARCFFGFVGFDAVATTGEEAINPQRNIPVSIMLGLLIIFVSYFGTAAVLTLMLPYYLQDDSAPLPAAFHAVHWETARWLVTLGALFGLSASLLGALFPLPRIIYAMSNDGLIFRSLGKTHAKYRTPLLATLLSGLMAAILSALFELHQLVEMLSIGTLLAYTLVATCVLILRYSDTSVGVVKSSAIDQSEQPPSYTSCDINLINVCSQLMNSRNQLVPDRLSVVIVNSCTVVFGVLSVCLGVLISTASHSLHHLHPIPLLILFILLMVTAICVCAIYSQPQSTAQLYFKVPCVPFLPLASIFINLYLMINLSVATWIRFVFWMILAANANKRLCMYFGYGIRHSSGGASEFIPLSDTSTCSVGNSSESVVSQKCERTALIR